MDMTDSNQRRNIDILCDLLPNFEPIALVVGPDDTVLDVLKQFEDDWNVPRLPSNCIVGEWNGELTGDDWTLREDRQIEEGRWWSEAEVEAFKDPLCDPSETLPATQSYVLIPPHTSTIRVEVTLPTTTATKPLSLKLPISPKITAFDLLEIIKSDLGLPTSTSDLVRNKSRGEKSRGRSRSHVSSIFSGAGSETEVGPRDEISWKIRIMPAMTDLGMAENVLESVLPHFKGNSTAYLTVEMDEGWLMEKVDPGSKNPSVNQEEEEEKDTLKASTSGQAVTLPAVTGSLSPPASFQGGTSSSNRLSGLFHGWLDANQHPAPPPSPQLSVVSGQGATRTPLNMHDLTGALKGDSRPILASNLRNVHSRPASISGPLRSPTGSMSPTTFAPEGLQNPIGMTAINEVEWEAFLDELNLQRSKRDGMAALPIDRKAYLLAQSKTKTTPPQTGTQGISHIQSPGSAKSTSPEISSPRLASFISLSAGTSLGLTRLLPQLTGGSTDSTRSPNIGKSGWGNHLSLASLGSWTGISAPSEADLLGAPAEEEEDGQITPRADMASLSERSDLDYSVMEKQTTGGLWGWWTGIANKPDEGSPAHFIKGLKDTNKTATAINKLLVSLRVTLSTAKLAFLHDFVRSAGLDALSDCLYRLTLTAAEAGSVGEQNVVEIVKSLRVLMNTDIGFLGVLDRPTLLFHIARAFRVPTLRMRCQAADLLSALCVLSPYEGHGLVLSALSEKHDGEPFRFQWLIDSLKATYGYSLGSDSEALISEGLWEWRSAVLGLLNALANTPDNLEVRCELRGELDRRGLNPALEALRQQSPPSSVIAQIDLYEDESKEDWAELRWLNLSEAEGGLHAAAGALIKAVESSEDLAEVVFDIVQRLGVSLSRDVDDELKLKLVTLLAKFGEHVLDIVSLEENWDHAVRRYIADIANIIPSASSLKFPTQRHLPGSDLKSPSVPAEKTTVADVEPSSTMAFGGADEFSARSVKMPSTSASPSVAVGERPLFTVDLDPVAASYSRGVVGPRNPDDVGEAGPSTSSVSPQISPSLSVPNLVPSPPAHCDPPPPPPPPPVPPPPPPLLPLKCTSSPPCDELDPQTHGFLGPATAAISTAPSLHPSSSPSSPHLPPPSPPPPPPPLFPPPPWGPPPPPEIAPSALLPLSVVPALALGSSSCLPPLAPPPPPPPPLPLLLPRASVLNHDKIVPPPPPPPPPPLAIPSTGPTPQPPPPGPSRPAIARPTAPKVKLKPFFWSKVPQYSVRGTIWSEVEPSSDVVFDDIVDIFAIDTTPVIKSDKKGKAKSSGVISVLDITRSNNVGIMLVRLRMSAKKIKRAILEVDDDALTVDDLATISRQLPSIEEAERLKAFEGDSDKLAKPDQYFREISNIPDLKNRLDSMVFRRRFDMLLGEIMPDLGSFRSAALELKTSERLPEVLAVVLSLGNTLNGGTFRGNAAGFQLEALTKLKETRTAKGSGCPTLLHYLAKVLIRADPRLILFLEEIPSLEAAARIAMTELSLSIDVMRKSLASTKTAALVKPSDPDDALQEALLPFIAIAEPKMDKLDRLFVDLQKELAGVLTYFGEKDGNAETLFNTILTFAHGLQKAAAEMTRHTVTDTPKKLDKPVIVSEKTVNVMSDRLDKHEAMLSAVTIKKPSASKSKVIPPPPPIPDTTHLGVAGGTMAKGRKSLRGTMSRGELDEAIRSIHGGVRRRERDTMGRSGGVRLSKMFLDGAHAGTTGAASLRLKADDR